MKIRVINSKLVFETGRTLKDLDSSCFTIGKGANQYGEIVDNTSKAITAKLPMEKGCSAYLCECEDYTIRPIIFNGDGEFISSYPSLPEGTGECRAAYSVDEDDCKVMIEVYSINGDMTNEKLEEALENYRYINSILPNINKVPIVIGAAVTSQDYIEENANRATIGPIKFSGSVSARTGQVNIKSYNKPYNFKFNVVADSYASYNSSQTTNGEKFVLIGYKNADGTAPTVEEILNDVSFS